MERERESPLLGLGAGLVESEPADLSLSGALTGDLERSSDLGPAGTLDSSGVDQQIRCPAQGLMGVSQALQVVQGPLGPGLRGLECLDGSAGVPARLSAFLGAHDNTDCHLEGRSGVVWATTRVDRKGSERPLTIVSTAFSWAVGRRGGGDTHLISSFIFRKAQVRAGFYREMNDPRDVGASGGLATTGVS